MGQHDRSYKLMFSHARVMADLVRAFLPPAVAQGAELGTLERVNPHFVSDDLRERADDLIWRVRVRGVWHYLIVEFQSSVDEAMPIRVVVYVGLLCQDLLKAGAIGRGQGMPPILPIVLYHGARPWTVPTDVRECQQSADWPFAPRLPYWLVAARQFERAPLLEGNVASAIIALECARTAERAQQVIDALAGWLRETRHEPVRRSIVTWLRRVLLPTRLPNTPLPDISTLQEVSAVLNDNDINWGTPYLEEGRRRGHASLLLRLLEAKFGPVPAHIKARVEEASEKEIVNWGLQFASADSLDAVIRPAPEVQ